MLLTVPPHPADGGSPVIHHRAGGMQTPGPRPLGVGGGQPRLESRTGPADVSVDVRELWAPLKTRCLLMTLKLWVRGRGCLSGSHNISEDFRYFSYAFL